MEKNLKIHIYIIESLCCMHDINTNYKPIMLQFFKKIGKELFNLKKIIIFKKVRKKQIKDDTRTFTTTERGP